MAPQFVNPYVKSNKNDANDAEAVCEAMSRPGMRFVAVNTVEKRTSRRYTGSAAGWSSNARQKPTRSVAW